MLDSSVIRVVLDTDLGDIVIEVDDRRAPLAAAYFLGLVDRAEFDGTRFYRSAVLEPGEGAARLIQGGLLHQSIRGPEVPRVSALGLPVLAEFDTTDKTGRRHGYGTISFARDLLETGVVIPDLVICLGNIPTMDARGRTQPDERGFPAFGRVVAGMDVVEAIASQETAGMTVIPMLQGQILSDPVLIKRARRR